MYILDFLKKLFRKEKIGIIIWLILNMVLLSLIFQFYGIPIYAVSICIALSPVGEWILRVLNGCRKIKNRLIAERLTPLFEEVYREAKKRNPELPDGIRLYINRDKEPNAFATGRKTICCTRGLLELDDEDIKGVLSHEFGHLAHRDTDVILVVAVGNMIVNLFFLLIRAVFWIIQAVLFFLSDDLVGPIIHFLITITISFGMWLWTKLGVLLCMHSSRKDEYAADAYGVDLGYGEGLAHALKTLSEGEESPKGLFASLSASHPDTQDRLDAIAERIHYGGQEAGDSLSAAPAEQNRKKRDSAVAPQIYCQSGRYRGAVFPIEYDEEISIGRDPASCAIIINPDVADVSRRHLAIRYDGRNQNYTVTDWSSNGSFFSNGVRLERGRSYILPRGSSVRLGKTEEFVLN